MSAEQPRTIGFICPKCRQSVIVERSFFSLTAAPTRIVCPCGGSYFQTEYQGDRFVVEAPCVSCGGRHIAHCPSDAFLHQKALSFTCGKTGLDCCCVGEREDVYRAMRRLEQAVDQMDADKDPEQEGTFLNGLVMEEMLGEIRDIAARGGVRCTCGSKQWTLQVRYSSIQLDCARCGGMLRLSAATMDDLNDLCCKDELVIRGAADGTR